MSSRRQSGQSMVEFALATPLLLLVLLSIVYFGRAFFVTQIVMAATQEGARLAARTPNLNDPVVRDSVRGFSTSGSTINQDSVIYASLASGFLLSGGQSGDLPAGSQVKILPWDSDGSATDLIPPGTVAVVINYPFHLLGGSLGTNNIAIAMSIDGSGSPVVLPNFTVSQRAVVSQEVYQEVN